MPTTRTRTRSAARIGRRTVIATAGAAVLLAVLAAGADPIVTAVSGRSIGTHLAEQDGRIDFHRYDRPDQAPAALLPTWMPATATAITVVRPGAGAGEGDVARIDAAVPARTGLPASCAPGSTWSMPFVVPDGWPDFTLEDLQTCDGWTLAARSGHWYLWGTLPAGALQVGRTR